MLKLDLGTIAFSTAAISIVAATLLPESGRVGRSRFGLRCFAAAMILYGIGFLLFLCWELLPAFVSIICGNGLVMLSAAALHAGCSSVVRRPPAVIPYALLFVAFLVAEAYFLYVHDSAAARLVAISVGRMVLFAHAALMLHAYRRKSPSRGWPCLKR